MLPIHYILFLPPTLIGGYYLGKKIKKNFTINKHSSIFWTIYSIFLLTTVLTLSVPTIIFAYSVVLFLVFDFLKWCAKTSKNNKFSTFFDKIYFKGIPLFLLAVVFTLYGVLEAKSPIIQSYEVKIQKKIKSPITIMLLSDLHLGTGTDTKTIDTIVDSTNKEKADIFLIAGDLFDERTRYPLKEYAIKNLGKIKTRYGIYYVEGNHDLLNDDTRKKMMQNHITPLEDENILINNTFYLVGRKDKKNKRENLKKIMETLDRKYPIILLDHRPEEEDIALKEGVDLQLAGHTHAGQIFPGNFFLKYGYFKKDDFHLIVSTGYGNWGIPVRTYTKNELVKVTLFESK